MTMKSRLGTTAATVVAYAITILIVFPIVWMAMTGLKDEVSAYQMPPSLAFTPTLDNFHNALDSGIMTYIYHSVVAVGASTILALALGIPAAFALVWHPRKSNEGVLFWLISTKFMPAVGVLIPLYIIFKDIHLLDTRGAHHRLRRRQPPLGRVDHVLVLQRHPQGPARSWKGRWRQ